MGKFEDVVDVPADSVRTAYAQTTHANAWVPFAQSMLRWVAIPFVAFVASTALFITGRISGELWLYIQAGAACLFGALVWHTYPKRLSVADMTLHNMERLLNVDIDNDGLVGAHPARINNMNGARETEARKQAFERDRLKSFVAAAARDSTVRGLRAQGWKDEELNATYRLWLFDIVRMPDGNSPAVTFGKGQWGIAYPVEEVWAAIDALTWVGLEKPTPAKVYE